jgi:hypothetical protein
MKLGWGKEGKEFCSFSSDNMPGTERKVFSYTFPHVIVTASLAATYF